MRKRATNKFTEEQYNTKRGAVLLLTENKLKTKQIAETLGISKSSVEEMRRHDYEQHEAFLKKALEIKANKEKKFEVVETAPDQTHKILLKLEAIEQKIDKLQKTKRFF